MKNQIFYVPIDFVGSDEKALAFKDKYVPYLLEARQMISDLSLPIKIAFKTTIIPNVSQERRQFFDLGIAELGKAGIDYFVDTWPSGPTRSMYGILFDQGVIATGFSAIATSDLDQFPPNSNLEKFIELYEQTMKNNSILGVGSRNVPIVLSANEEDAYLRRIFEGFMNLAARRTANKCRNKIIIVHPEEAPSDPAYASHSDLITGIYLFNPNHNNRRPFIEKLVRTARDNDFFGFEDEYYMVLEAPRFGGISALYFNSVRNPFEKIEPISEREKIIAKQIKASLKSLAKTSIAPIIRESIESYKKDLSIFYTKEQVDEVANYMLETLNN